MTSCENQQAGSLFLAVWQKSRQNIFPSEAKLQERLSLAANGQTLPKHQTGEGILQTVPRPVLLLCVSGRIVQLD